MIRIGIFVRVETESIRYKERGSKVSVLVQQPRLSKVRHNSCQQRNVICDLFVHGIERLRRTIILKLPDNNPAVEGEGGGKLNISCTAQELVHGLTIQRNTHYFQEDSHLEHRSSDHR